MAPIGMLEAISAVSAFINSVGSPHPDDESWIVSKPDLCPKLEAASDACQNLLNAQFFDGQLVDKHLLDLNSTLWHIRMRWADLGRVVWRDEIDRIRRLCDAVAGVEGATSVVRNEDWYAAHWFDSNYGLTAERLRKAAQRGQIQSRKPPGSRSNDAHNQYPFHEVRKRWPEKFHPKA